jgi:hypothetical protein
MTVPAAIGQSALDSVLLAASILRQVFFSGHAGIFRAFAPFSAVLAATQ